MAKGWSEVCFMVDNRGNSVIMRLMLFMQGGNQPLHSRCECMNFPPWGQYGCIMESPGPPNFSWSMEALLGINMHSEISQILEPLQCSDIPWAICFLMQ